MLGLPADDLRFWFLAKAYTLKPEPSALGLRACKFKTCGIQGRDPGAKEPISPNLHMPLAGLLVGN